MVERFPVHEGGTPRCVNALPLSNRPAIQTLSGVTGSTEVTGSSSIW
jgi:hypothetical protein